MKIIFLDIDGPLKSVRSYFIPEDEDVERGNLDPLIVQLLKYLCHRMPARVVFNSRWNEPALMRQLAADGFPMDIVHEDGMTLFKSHSLKRLHAINDWLLRHNMPAVGPEGNRRSSENWVAFDDVPIDHPNAILIDREVGITPYDYRKATEILGNPDPFVVLL